LGQEFFIKSDNLESKVRTLLPSQGGLGAGFDLSASTQIIPIIDLTESAEGSNLRQDLQTAFSFDSATVHDVTNTTSTIINNTGYFRVFSSVRISGSVDCTVQVSDGAATKNLFKLEGFTGASFIKNLDFIVFNPAGYSVIFISSGTAGRFLGNSRQVATIDGELVNP
jgi:hypothetical protein